MDSLELASLCLLHSIKGIGNRTICKIKKNYGNFHDFICMESSRLYRSFLLPGLAEELIALRRDTSPLNYLERIYSQGIKVVTVEDPEYPTLLATIADPPYLLYYCGNVSVAAKICFAIVGSRAATVYGKKIACQIAHQLAENDLVVVSGMARGIDTEAHQGALAAGGKTIAVLGNGLDIIYPPENTRLFAEIRAEGLILSEFPPRTPPEPGNFPRRNRIISGLSRGVVVVEARKKSGALITADMALEQGRDVFAVPGPVTSKNSEGTNNLIKQGAHLVTGIDDILEDYYDIKLTPVICQPELRIDLDSEETRVIEFMGYEPLHFDHLIKMTGFDIGRLSTVMLALELKGLVKSMPGNYYVKIV